MRARSLRLGPALTGAVVLLGAVLVMPARAAAQNAGNACATCHAGLQDARLSMPATLVAGPDVHRASGFQCAECHGGDAAAADTTRAHDAARGFKGKPAGGAIVATCGRCHSDAEFMRRFAPRQRVDQAAEYATSVHGKRLSQGDANVATCVSCHGAHGIRAVNDVQSPVYPTSVATTCAKCHANATLMAGYKLPNGKPLPTSQLDDYRKSVHDAALTKGHDLSAPTCNDCHGNHGAAPPGVGSVPNVCGTCHAVFAQKFAGTVHAQIFDAGCVECHGNHAVLKPSDEMLGAQAGAICATCHEGADDKGALAAAAMRSDIDRLKAGIEQATALIDRVSNAGMEVSAQELALASARSKLTQARTEMHTFDPSKVNPIVADGLTIVQGVDAAGTQAAADLRYRRRGLVVSLGAILLVVVALWLKIRQIERR